MASDVPWFVRELLAPGMAINLRITDMAVNGDRMPDFSDTQLVVLGLLQASCRKLDFVKVVDDIVKISRYCARLNLWSNLEGRREIIMCQRTRQSIFLLKSGQFSWFKMYNPLFSVGLYETMVTLRPGVERHSSTDKFESERRMMETPVAAVYHHEKRYDHNKLREKASASIKFYRLIADGKMQSGEPCHIHRLPGDLMLQIFKFAVELDCVLIFHREYASYRHIRNNSRVFTAQYRQDMFEYGWVMVDAELDHTMQHGWDLKTLNLRLVSRWWGSLILGAFFHNLIVLEQVENQGFFWSNDPLRPASSYGDWFVPLQKTIEITDFAFEIRYRIGDYSPAKPTCSIRLKCVRGIFSLGIDRDYSTTVQVLTKRLICTDTRCPSAATTSWEYGSAEVLSLPTSVISIYNRVGNTRSDVSSKT
jgi:hypothetical protein